MERSCAQCGTPFVAVRPAAKFCGATCRQRAKRAGSSGAVVTTLMPVVEVDEDEAPLVGVTRRALEDAGVLDTVDGAQALILAARVSSSHETGSAVAALSKQLQALVSAALSSVSRADQMDEVTRRRDEKLRRARGA